MSAWLDLESDYTEIGPPTGDLAEAMGEAGLAAYWSQIEAEWEELSPIRPAERKQQARRVAAYDGRRSRLTARMLANARERGDADAEITVLKMTLEHSHDYLRLADRLHRLGQIGEAAETIDEALWLFGEDDSIPLVKEGARILAAAGESTRALDLLWRQFTRHPHTDDYYDLLAVAAQAQEEEAWRDKSLAWLENLRSARLREEETPVLWGETAEARAADVLVTIALKENDLERAWEVANAGMLSRGVWEQLAKTSEAVRPRDAIRVYKALAERAVAMTNKGGYREAIGVIRRIRRLARDAGIDDEIGDWLTTLRAENRRKRSFIAMLDAALAGDE